MSRYPRLRLTLILTLLAGRALGQAPTTTPAPTTRPAPTTQSGISVEAHFSPEEQVAPTIVKLIDNARHTVDIAAFSFTHPDIAAAAVRAHQRGVRVRFLMDYTQSRLTYCRAADLIDAGIEVRTRHRRGF